MMPRLEHIGIAVEDAEAVAAVYSALLGKAPYKAETVAREGVRTHFISAESAKLELLESLHPDSPVARFLSRRGEGVHHLAFEVEDLAAEMERLRRAGFALLSEAPRPGADGKQICFIHPRSTHGVLVELCQSTTAPLERTAVPFEAGHLAAYTAGRRDHPPLLLLHGAAGTTLLETEGLIRRLEPHYFVLGVDFSGHGASDAAAVPFSLDLFAENARAVLDTFGLERAHLFGFSMGGAVALHLARRSPARVARLALHATNVFWTQDLVAAMLARLDPDVIAQQSPRAAERLRAAHGPERWPELARNLRTFIRTLPEQMPGEADLGQIPSPTLLSAGDADDLFSLDQTLRLYRSLPGSALALLPGTRHTIETVDLDLLARLLRGHFG